LEGEHLLLGTPFLKTRFGRVLVRLVTIPLMLGAAIAALLAAIFVLAFFADHPYLIPIVPFTVGLYVWARGDRYLKEKDGDSRTGRLLTTLDTLSTIATFSPIFLSFVAAAVVVGFRGLAWLGKGAIPDLTVQTLWHWPASQADIETGAIGFDRITWWLFAEAPFEFWLIVVAPAIWLIAAQRAKWVTVGLGIAAFGFIGSHKK
jgi:hypothetical protein